MNHLRPTHPRSGALRSVSTRAAAPLLAVLLAALLSLAATFPATAAAQETTSGAQETGAPQLQPIPEPNLEGMDEEVRQQLEDKRRALALVLTRLQEQAEAGQPASLEPAGAAFGGLGALYFLYGETEAAEPALANASRLQPDELRWPYLLGFVQQTLGKLEAAADSYARVMEMNPEFVPVLLRLGELRLAAGDPGTDLKALLKA